MYRYSSLAVKLINTLKKTINKPFFILYNKLKNLNENYTNKKSNYLQMKSQNTISETFFNSKKATYVNLTFNIFQYCIFYVMFNPNQNIIHNSCGVKTYKNCSTRHSQEI